jgi:hypothetical protein
VEPKSPFVGESQPGPVPLHRIGQGQMPPALIKSGPDGFVSLSQAIPAENLDDLMLLRMKGLKETS